MTLTLAPRTCNQCAEEEYPIMSTETTVIQHSPGPWDALIEAEGFRPGKFYPVWHIQAAGAASQTVVPEVWGSSDAMRRANARLIAAAPDLLEALKGALAYIHEYCAEDLHEAEDVAWTFNAAKSLIAKAEGRGS